LRRALGKVKQTDPPTLLALRGNETIRTAEEGVGASNIVSKSLQVFQRKFQAEYECSLFSVHTRLTANAA
jgi:hypothetical protein